MKAPKSFLIVLLSIFILFDSLEISFSQSGWIKQNPPTSSYLTDICMLNSQTGWAVGYNATILKTTNSGLNWFTQDAQVSVYLDFINVFFASESVGWISVSTDPTYVFVNLDNLILKTTNGGNNWFTQYSDPNLTPGGIYFVNPQTGWVTLESVNTAYMLKTTNSGDNWKQTTVGSSGTIRSICFVSDQIGWVGGGTDNAIYKTTDGGQSWSQQSAQGGYSIMSISFTSPDNGWCASSSSGTLYKTTNGGTNWNFVNMNTVYSLTSVFFMNNSTGWVMGEYGRIYYTTDAGINWIQNNNLTHAYLNSIKFVSPTTGWFVGETGTIYRTTTGGF